MELGERRFATDEACGEYLAQLRWPGGLLVPGVRRREGVGARPRAQDVRDVRASGVRDGGNDLPRHPHAADAVVPRDLVGGQPEGRGPARRACNVSWGSAATAPPGRGSTSCAAPWCAPAGRRLTGAVEVDETFVGGAEPGGGRRHIGKKALVVVAAEVRGPAIGRIRLRRVADSSAASLLPFVQEAVTPGTVVITDGLQSYRGLPEVGYRHDRRVLLGSGESADAVLPRVHRVASLLKRWLLGTHQGAVSREHLDYYLDEFTFRFNRLDLPPPRQAVLPPVGASRGCGPRALRRDGQGRTGPAQATASQPVVGTGVRAYPHVLTNGVCP